MSAAFIFVFLLLLILGLLGFVIAVAAIIDVLRLEKDINEQDPKYDAYKRKTNKDT